jgi:hypothetical protein
MVEYTKEEILRSIKEDEYPIFGTVGDTGLLSMIQLDFAKKAQNRDAACVAQWVVQVNGGKIDEDTFRKLCKVGVFAYVR